MTAPAALSVIVPVRPGGGDPSEAHRACREALEGPDRNVEFVYVIDGPHPAAVERLLELRRSGESLRIIRLARTFGDAAAIRIGLRYASGKTILTLPPDLRVDPQELPRLRAALDGNDLVVAVRHPRPGKAFRRLRAAVFDALAGALSDVRVHDLGCAVRLGRREVFEEVPPHGGQDLFLPVLARRLGFRVAAVDVRNGSLGGDRAAKAPGENDGSLLELLSLFFLTRFSRKPLRFFGLIAGPVFGAGLIAFVYLLYVKLAHGQPLADRPLLLLSVLLLVLGAQIFALGLVAEIVVYTHLRDVKAYAIEEIVG